MDDKTDISIDEWVKKIDPFDDEAVKENALSFYLKSRSMTPLARPITDEIIVVRAHSNKIRKYDIIVFYNTVLGYVCHRVVDICKDGFITMGDANTQKDLKIPKDIVVGKVVHIQRGAWSIHPESTFWRLYGRIWYYLRFVRIPLMKLIYVIPKMKKSIKGK